MTKLTYDAQGFIVHAKKNEQLGAKIADDTTKIARLIQKQGQLTCADAHFIKKNLTKSPKQAKTNDNSTVAKPTTKTSRHLVKQAGVGSIGQTPKPSTSKPSIATVQASDTKKLVHRTNERIKAHARTSLPKPKHATPALSASLPTAKPTLSKQERAFDDKILRLLSRLAVGIAKRRKKQGGQTGGMLGLLLSLLSFLPIGRLLKGGKWLLKFLKGNAVKRIPLLSALIGGVGLLANWGNLTAEQKAVQSGKLVGRVGGMLAGAMIGQAIIPIPIVGALVGAIVGEKLGGFVGRTAGGGLYAIATGAFREWLGSFGVVGKGLLTLWDNGIKPLIAGANDSLAWFKNNLMAFGETLKGVYQMAVDNTSEQIENAVNSVQSLWGQGKAFFGVSSDVFVPAQNAIKAANYAVKHANGYMAFLGRCAEYVNNAFQALGYRASGHGYEVADNLYKMNKGKFEYVAYDPKTYVPQVGDVMSFTAGKRVGARQRAKFKGKTYGHVQIYTEKGWVSDTVQKSMWSGNDYKADYADGSGKIIVVRPVGGKYTNSATPAKSTKPAGTNSVLSGYHTGVYQSTGIKYPHIGTISENELVAVAGEQRIHKMAQADYQKMAADFQKATGKSLTVQSGYRSVAYQQGIIDRKKKQGLSDKAIYSVSAPAGFSEHQTGLAMDFSIGGNTNLTNKGVWADNSIGYQWLKANAHKYGFVQTYTKGNAQGVAQENWHWAYRGNQKARELLGGLDVPAQPSVLPNIPSYSKTPKQAGQNTVLVPQNTKPKDRSPIHKVV